MTSTSSDPSGLNQGPKGSTKVSLDIVIPYCLVYLNSRGKVLLIKKSEGRSHAGEWIGLGGKLEPGEDPVSAAVREFREESGLTIADPQLRGTFIWIDEVHCGIVHIVTATKWTGTLTDSEEGELQWHRIEDLGTLPGLASHQPLFLDAVMLDCDRFYSGAAVVREYKMVEYADNQSP
ncbi:MAG: 8-oxo-dGTP diphosphatase [Chloroflexi bacterium]|nr:8-oxo-dGTP diphosphatase [Chloroflexota bacterium]